MDYEELRTIIGEQSREVAAAKAVESDLDLAFELQMQEAVNASLHLQPSASLSLSLSLSSSSTPPQFQRQDKDASGPGFASLLAEEISRFEQERCDSEQAEADMKSMREDLNRWIHDQAFANDLSRISDEEWKNTGDYFSRPYGEGSSTAVPNAEAFRLYFKGLLREEMVGGAKKMLAGIGIAICDLRDDRIFELRKPLFGSSMNHEAAEVEALIEGLDTAINLGMKRVIIFCGDDLLYRYVTGKSFPMEENIATLVGQMTLLQRKFSYCVPSFVAQKDIKFAVELALEAIVSQIISPSESNSGKNLKETCLICLEDTEVSQMFFVSDCLHRYCFSCMKNHAQMKLLQGMLPKCPHEGCKTKLKLESCKTLLTSELYDTVTQRLQEASIPATQKIYCPYPRCSALMTKTEALRNAHNSEVSRCVRCNGLFCLKCRVPWHSNMTCYDYKRLQPYPCTEDAQLNSLAKRNLWKQCVKCNHMVELAAGCNHIYCRCGYEFCYTCGAEWKNKKATCACPLWDERNILYEHDRLQRRRQ